MSPPPCSSRSAHTSSEGAADDTSGWWAISQIRREHTSIHAIARQIDTTRDTVWPSSKPQLQGMSDKETRSSGVTRLGVDEHEWHQVSEFPIEDR